MPTADQVSPRLDLSLSPGSQAHAQLRTWLNARLLSPGQRLPSERALATQLGLSRAAVRTALQLLEEDGLVVGTGRRRRVGQTPGASSSATPVSHTLAVLVERGGATPGPATSSEAPGWSVYTYRGANEAILAAGYSALTVPLERLTKGHGRAAFANPVAGLLVLTAPPGITSKRQLLTALGLPDLPLVTGEFDQPWPDADSVVSDQEGGSRALTTWLISQGCRRPLRCWQHFAVTPEWLTRRDAGFIAACQAAPLPVLPPLSIPALTVAPASNPVDAYRHLWAGYLLPYLTGPEPVDALLAISDGLVTEISAACRLLGKEPGRDVRVVGYDNYWRQTGGPDTTREVPAATVDKHNRECGHACVDLLLQRLRGELPPAPQRRVIPAELVPNLG